MRTHKGLDERARLRRIVFTAHDGRELRQMLRQRRRNVEQAAVGARQMLEVQRALLLSRELGRQHGKDRTADDARFDERAGVDADHRDAVEHRVVVISTRVAVHRIGSGTRPDAHRLEHRWIEVGPLRRILRMRTNQNGRPAQLRIRRVSYRLDPLAHEAHFVRRDERRGTEIQQQRPIRRDTHLDAKVVARGRRPLQEPMIVGLRTGDADHTGIDAVQLGGFGALKFIPDDDAMWTFVNAAFGREVIPAADAEDARNTGGLRRAHVLNLLRAEIQERRDQEQIGPMLGENARRGVSWRHRALDGAKHPLPYPHRESRSDERHLRKSRGKLRSLARRAGAEAW